jgi:hypothetical protein
MRNRRNPRSFSSSSTSTLAWAALAAGALLIGLPGRAAFAAQPATADEARAMAAQCGEQAAQLRASAAAGAAFKAGLIQRDEACAARYTALADQLAGQVAGTEAATVASPQAEHYRALAAHDRFIGGAAYKTGLVQDAEAQARRYEAAPAAATETPAPTAVCVADKPIVRLECPAS